MKIIKLTCKDIYTLIYDNVYDISHFGGLPYDMDLRYNEIMYALYKGGENEISIEEESSGKVELTGIHIYKLISKNINKLKEFANFDSRYDMDIINNDLMYALNNSNNYKISVNKN